MGVNNVTAKGRTYKTKSLKMLKRNVVSNQNAVWAFSKINEAPNRLLVSDHTHSSFITNDISDFIDSLSKTMAAIQKKIPQSVVKLLQIRRFYHFFSVSNGQGEANKNLCIFSARAATLGIKAAKKIIKGSKQMTTDNKYREFEKSGSLEQAFKDFDKLKARDTLSFKLPDGASICFITESYTQV